MATRTVLLTPAELCECVADRAFELVRGEQSKVDVVVEFGGTAEGMTARVTFTDKGAARPASLPPIAVKI